MKQKDAAYLILALLIGPFGWITPASPAAAAAPETATAPVVVEHRPARGEETPLEGDVVVVFDRPMDQASVSSAFRVDPPVPGSFSWPDERTVSFRPAQPLQREATYEIRIEDTAQDRQGSRLAEPFRLTVRTVGYLRVTQVIPAPGSADVEALSTITVLFNRPVVPLTSLEQQTELPQPLEFEPAVEGVGEWLNTSIYTFKPGSPLAGGTEYHARISGELADTTGGVMPEPFEWSFSTQTPQMVWHAPENDASLVGIKTPIQIAFSQPIDCGSAEGAFRLVNTRSDDPVSGKASCDGPTFVFVPGAPLEFDSHYRAEMAPGVISSSGGMGLQEGFRWGFSTVPLPHIVRTTPNDGERDTSPFTDFSVEFNAPIDPTSVMDRIEFTPAITAGQVYTYYNDWDRTFHIDFGAKPSRDYHVTVRPGIRDPYSNETSEDFDVRFRTSALPPEAQLLVPDTVSTLSSRGQARVFVRYLNTARLDFRLYRLDFDTMLRAIDDWYEFEPPRSSLVRRWPKSVEAPLDEAQSVAIDLTEDGGSLDPGIYMLTLTSPRVEQQRWSHRHLLVVSPLNLTLKSSDDLTLAWATDIDTGQPMADLPLQLADSDGTLLGDARTDALGLAVFNRHASSSPLYVVGNDPFGLVSTRWDDGIGGGSFGFDRAYGAANARMHLYTDRPIYRAGQVVYFRGIVREEQDVAYTLPRETTVTVQIQDTSGETVLDEQLSLDDFGAFSGELTLAAGAPLGYYSLRVDYDGVADSVSFQVAAYRPPEFEVVVQAPPEIAAGDSATATVQVSYYFGGPVTSVPVEWNILARRYTHQSERFGRYSFSDTDDPWTCFDCWWRPVAPPQPILSGQGQTDAQGRLVIELPADAARLGLDPGRDIVGSRELTIEATVLNRDGSTLSGRTEMVVHQGEFYVGLAPEQRVGRAGKEMAVEVVTVDWDDERKPNQPLDVEVYRREWINSYVENQVGGDWKWETRDELVAADHATTNAEAEAVVRFTPETGGSFRVVVNGRDQYERLVRSSVFVWVSSPETVSWRRENNDRIDLIADKSTYSVGDTAEILIPSPFEGEQWALLTIERGSILHHEVIQLPNNSYVYRLPITERHLPNIYVSAVIVKGGDAPGKSSQYKVGYTALGVRLDPVRMNLTLTAGVPKAGPGETVAFDVQATDDSGQPIQAALSLDLVDKAVLSLSPRPADAVVDAFYGRRGLGVDTASGLSISLDRLILQQLEEEAARQKVVNESFGMAADGAPAMMPAAPMATAMPGEADMRAKGGAAPPPGVTLREEFQDTAYWNPTAQTDANGHATISIKLPDNLTTWTLRGVGVNAQTRVGEAVTDLLVTKPLLVRPVTPRFFVVGDRMQLAAIVSNTTDEAQDVRVALSSTGLELSNPAEQSILIDASAEAKVSWSVTVSDVESVDAIFSAVSGSYSDAARPRLTTGLDGTLLVRRYTAPDIVGTGGEIDAGGSRTEVVALPPRYDDRQGELSVRLDPSLAAGMQDSLSYLEHFPYECAEQTVSRFLPNVLTYRALHVLGLSQPELESSLPGLVQQGLDKLYTQQHGDGGWGWWVDDDSSPHISAYVVFGLLKAAEAGFEIRGDVLNAGLEFLHAQIVPAGQLESVETANRQAFVLYVLAQAPAAAAGNLGPELDDLFQKRGKLSHYARAYLAMAINQIDPEDPRQKTLLSDLQNAAILSATGAHWEEKDYDRWAMNTDTRSTAIILEAFTHLDPENALNPNVVRWLMVARKGGVWETTQENAWALIALTDWMAATGELKAEYDYSVLLNGRALGAGAVDSTNVRKSVQLQAAVAELLRDAGNRLTLERSDGPGRLYYAAHLKVFLPVEDIEPADRGLAVYREYLPADCVDEERCAQVNEAQVGGTVQVRLTLVVPHDLYYVMVEDPLPAGAEAIDVNLATASSISPQPGLERIPEEEKGYRYGWWWQWYSRTEIRDDRVVLFADYLPAGTYRYTYAFQARLAGEYRVIPTVANEMYFPEVFGRSDGRLFKIVESNR